MELDAPLPGASNYRWRAYLGGGAIYFILSLILWNRLFASGFTHGTTWIEFDSAPFIYVNAWVAHAVTHFDNPFYIPLLNYPRGLNGFSTGPSFLFLPATWAFGPIGSFNLQLLCAPVATAWAMQFAIRPWLRNKWIAIVIAIAWAFNPFAVTMLKRGWLDLGILAYPAIVFWVASDLLHFRRYSPRRLGVILGVATVLQFFLGTEVIVLTSIATLVALVVVTIRAAIGNHDVFGERIRPLGVCAGWAASISVVCLAWPLYFQLDGPDKMATWVRSPFFLKQQVMPMHGMLFRLPGYGTTIPHFHEVYPNPYFVGVILVAVAIVAAVILRHHPLTAPMVAIGLVGIWVARGYGTFASPDGLILHLPVLHNMTVTRFFLFILFSLIVILALLADRIEVNLATTGRRALAVFAAAALLAVSLAPMAVAVAERGIPKYSLSIGDDALPYVLAQPGYHRVFTFPSPEVHRAMIQQARTGKFTYSLSGGTVPEMVNVFGPLRPGTDVLKGLSYNYVLASPTPYQLGQVVFAMHRWKSTDVIVPVRLKGGIGYSSPYMMTAAMTELLGPPKLVSGEWVWVRVHPKVPAVLLKNEQWGLCISVPLYNTAENVPACVEEQLAANQSAHP